jgi:hypothetical protein
VGTNADDGVEEEDDDFDWAATLTKWQREQMKVKLFTLFEVLSALPDMWQQIISACKTLGATQTKCRLCAPRHQREPGLWSRNDCREAAGV